jgi:hypothetical protein
VNGRKKRGWKLVIRPAGGGQERAVVAVGDSSSILLADVWSVPAVGGQPRLLAHRTEPPSRRAAPSGVWGRLKAGITAKLRQGANRQSPTTAKSLPGLEPKAIFWGQPKATEGEPQAAFWGQPGLS